MKALLRRIAYQPEYPTTLGPFWSALGAGYVELRADGLVHITPVGRRALSERGKE